MQTQVCILCGRGWTLAAVMAACPCCTGRWVLAAAPGVAASAGGASLTHMDALCKEVGVGCNMRGTVCVSCPCILLSHAAIYTEAVNLCHCQVQPLQVQVSPGCGTLPTRALYKEGGCYCEPPLLEGSLF